MVYIRGESLSYPYPGAPLRDVLIVLSQEFKQTANLTVQAAKALWHFGEHWLSSFPGYTTQSNKVSFWVCTNHPLASSEHLSYERQGNSYGGYWVPETAAQFSKNLKAVPQSHPLESKCLTVDTIGITNGCVDFETGAAGYPQWAYNNTYGVRFASNAQYESAMHNLTKPGGGLDLIKECRALGEASDPGFSGSNATVNKLCEEAFDYAALYVVGGFPKLNKVSDADFYPCSVEMKLTHRSARCLRYCDHR
jgi:carboxypeptidase D